MNKNNFYFVKSFPLDKQSSVTKRIRFTQLFLLLGYSQQGISMDTKGFVLFVVLYLIALDN